MKLSQSFLGLGLLIGALGLAPHADAATWISKDPFTSDVISIRYTDDTTGAITKDEFFSYRSPGKLRLKSTVSYTNGFRTQSVDESYDSVTGKVSTRQTRDGAGRPVQSENFSYFSTGSLRNKSTSSFKNGVRSGIVDESYDSVTGKVSMRETRDGVRRLVQGEFFSYFSTGSLRNKSTASFTNGVRSGIVDESYDSVTGKVSMRETRDGAGRPVQSEFFSYFSTGSLRNKSTASFTNGVLTQSVDESYDSVTGKVSMRETRDGARRPVQIEFFSYFSTGSLRNKSTSWFRNGVLAHSVYENYDSVTGKVVTLETRDGSWQLLQREIFGYHASGVVRSKATETYANGLPVQRVVEEFDESGKLLVTRVFDATGKLVRRY